MAKKEYPLITRLKKLLSIFNAYNSRGQTTKSVLPPMNEAVADIISAVRIIEAGLGHIGEAYFDEDELKHEFAHIALFAINLPTTIKYDAGYWSYALDLVDPEKFEEGAEAVNLEQIELLSAALNRIITIKRENRDKALQAGLLDE